MEVTECMEFMYIMGLIDGMDSKDFLNIAIAASAFVVALYAAFFGLKFQLKLHVMSLIAAKAGQANSFWERENDSNKKHITDTITSVIRAIQLIEKIQSDHKVQLKGSLDIFLTYFYLELYDSIHNKFMETTKDPKTLAEELFPKQNDEGKKIISSQLTFIRDHFRTIHERYTKKDI